MINNLKGYLKYGLIKSEFKNIAIRRLASETCHEFIEWMGLIEDSKSPDLFRVNKKIFKDDLYLDFIKDNPDFAPKAKMTISRTVFYKWLNSFGVFSKDCDVEEGRSNQGRWIMFKTKDYEEDNRAEEFEF